jgi:ketosteroid isomerase-like protein
MGESKPLSPRDVVRETHRAVLAGDADGFARRFAENAVVEFPFSVEATVPPRVEGRDSIRKMATALGKHFERAGSRLRRFENLIVHETTDPEVLVVEFEALGEARANESAYRLPAYSRALARGAAGGGPRTRWVDLGLRT